MLTIGTAVIEDLDEVLALVREAIADMNERGIHQWNEQYPQDYLIKWDIEKDMLHVARDGDVIVGSISLTYEGDVEYRDVEWTDIDGKYLVVHRLVVHPEHQRLGVASTLMEHAEKMARDTGCTSMRLDTFSENPRSLAFFTKQGYERKPGHIHFPENVEPYFCFEKVFQTD